MDWSNARSERGEPRSGRGAQQAAVTFGSAVAASALDPQIEQRVLASIKDLGTTVLRLSAQSVDAT